ncbi:major capsid family protein, partial [Stenotrophomonas maltophilia]
DFNASLSDSENLFDGDVSVQPDTYLMASNQYMHLSTRVVPDSGGKTFLKYIEENNIFTTQGKTLTIRGLGRSNGKGTAGA